MTEDVVQIIVNKNTDESEDLGPLVNYIYRCNGKSWHEPDGPGPGN